jgi:hypothetical protein
VAATTTPARGSTIRRASTCRMASSSSRSREHAFEERRVDEL